MTKKDCLTPFETFLIDWDKKRQREFKAQDHHRPSSARIEYKGEVIGACMRSQYYAWMGVEPTEKPDLKGLYNFYLGSIFEDRYEDGLKLQEAVYKREEPFQVAIGLKNVLSARIDYVIKPNGHWEGVEIKSAYGMGMNFQKRDGKPKSNYILQMMLYLEYCPLKLAMIHNPTYARDSFYRLPFRLYGNENGTFTINGNKGDIHIPWTCDMIKDSWKKLEDYVEKKELPPKDFSGWCGDCKDMTSTKKHKCKTGWQCIYCNYRTKCNKEVS